MKKSVAFGKRSSSFPIECICSSPLLRALETAAILQGFHPNGEVKVIDELKERG